MFHQNKDDHPSNFFQYNDFCLVFVSSTIVFYTNFHETGSFKFKPQLHLFLPILQNLSPYDVTYKLQKKQS